MRGALVVLTACSFSSPVPGAAVDGNDQPIDAAVDAPPDAAPDGSPDAPPDAPVTLCAVGVTNPDGEDRGRVGGNGGSAQRDPLACDAGQQIVGLSLRMSNQTTANGRRSAYALVIGCAGVTVDSTGVGSTGAITPKELTANGGFSWTPATLTSMTVCQPGWIVSGIAAHTGPSTNVFLDVTITCAQIGPTGSPTGTTEELYVQGSLDENAGSDSVACNGGEVLARLPNRIGAGIDSVNLWCSTLACN